MISCSVSRNNRNPASGCNSRRSQLFSRKTQTATEYLIITAVVIVIALIVIGILGGIPGIGRNVLSNSQKAILESRPVGIVNIAFYNFTGKIRFRNNLGNTIKIHDVYYDNNQPCYISPFQLKSGEAKVKTCMKLTLPTKVLGCKKTHNSLLNKLVMLFLS